MSTATELLKEVFTDNQIADYQKEAVQKAVDQFVALMETEHVPIQSESGISLVCAHCSNDDGGPAEWPCRTMQAIHKYLKEKR